MKMRTENWCGYDIRFVLLDDGEWWAVLKDICDALDLRTDKVAYRLEPERLAKVPIETHYTRVRPLLYREKFSDHPLRGIGKNQSVSSATVHMLVVDELGIYKALFASRRLEARQFTDWVAMTVKRLRQRAGLDSCEALHMTDPYIERKIGQDLDDLFWDDGRDCYVRSRTDRWGDTEQEYYDYYGRRIDMEDI